jgi:hypothetical protein
MNQVHRRISRLNRRPAIGIRAEEHGEILREFFQQVY